AAYGPGVTAGYFVQTNSSKEGCPHYTGSLFGPGYELWMVRQPPVPAETWFTQDIIAEGPRIRIRVNEKPLVDYCDAEHRFIRGRIALSTLGPTPAVRYRFLRVKRLPPSPRASP